MPYLDQKPLVDPVQNPVKIEKFITTIGQAVASVAIVTRSAVAAEARGVVGAECILGTLLLESGDVERQMRLRLQTF